MHSHRSWAPLLLLGGGLALSAPQLSAQQPSATEDALRQRVEELEQKLQRLEERLGQQPAPSASDAQPAQSAGEPSPREQALQQRVEELDQQVKVLGRKQELQQEEQDAAKKSSPIVTAAESGLTVRSPDGLGSFRLRGLLQTDGRLFTDSAGGTDTFLLRRVRPIFEGTLGGIYDFRFTPDFASGRAVIQDAYLHARFKPYAQLRVGKFKEPVGLERLQGGADIRFVERAYPTNVLPNRDIGLQLSGELLDSRIEYQVGYFNGVVDGRSSEDFTNEQDNNADKDWATRVFAHPFRDGVGPLQGLGIGVAATYVSAGGRSGTTVQETSLPSYRSIAQQVFFSYRTGATNGTFADGERMRLSPQAYWYWRSLGVIAEYALVSQDVRRNPAPGTTLAATLDHAAWQVAATYVLTGEDNSFRGIKPREPFQLGKPGWGAFEVGARYTQLELDDDTFSGGASSFADPTASARSAKTWGAVLNWYLNANVRLVVDYENTAFEWGGGGTAAAPLDRPDEELVFVRFQTAF
ncbi:MAG TPA: porin [Burkholderiales bacterium]|nr:porin [Burkholderiales bacterium]